MLTASQIHIILCIRSFEEVMDDTLQQWSQEQSETQASPQAHFKV